MASSVSRRKARRRGSRVEPYDRLEVFARDGWRCWLCGHVVPLSRGGADAPDNVHCAHHGCNVRRGAAVPPV